MSQEKSVDCKVFRDLVTDYTEQALSPSMELAMQRHKERCEKCEEFIGQIQLTVEALGSLKREMPAEPIPQNLMAAFRNWRRSAVDCKIQDPEALMRELLALSPGEQLIDVGVEHKYLDSNLGGLLVDEAVRMGIENPEESLCLANLAVEILRTLESSSSTDSAAKSDNLGRALVVLGNCRRICSDFAGAAGAFSQAQGALENGTGKKGAKAYLFQVRAQFLADRGQLHEAINDLDNAIQIYKAESDRHCEGRTLIGKGRVLGFSGYVEDAIPCLLQGLELIEVRRDPRLVLVAKHNLVEYLFDCGNHAEARVLLEETRELHKVLSNAVDLIRFKWLEGKIALDSGDLDEAERLLLEVKTYFVDQEMSHDVAVVSLDLAMVYLKQARTAELKSLAGEMITIFSGLGIRREIFAALAFFNKAQEIETTATVSLLQELADAVENARQPGNIRPG